jgi:hypothetical protein
MRLRSADGVINGLVPLVASRGACLSNQMGVPLPLIGFSLYEGLSS